jgi:hypothetical protein
LNNFLEFTRENISEANVFFKVNAQALREFGLGLKNARRHGKARTLGSVRYRYATASNMQAGLDTIRRITG